MAKQAVSQGFANFMARNEHKFEDAKKAENNMSGLSLPIGAEGTATVIEMTADVSKKKADGKGGNPYVRVKYNVNTPEEHSGASFTKVHTFFDSANASQADRYQWFLNEVENHGLPREIRENGSIEDIINWFQEEDRVAHYSVIEDSYGNDGKSVRILPTTTEAPTLASPTEIRHVKYAGSLHKVVGESDNDLEIENIKTGRVRTVAKDAVEEA